MSAGSEKMEKLLESVAEEIAGAVLMEPPEGLGDDGTPSALRVLKRRLLPLLESGARLRSTCAVRELTDPYDAALRAAQEQK